MDNHKHTHEVASLQVVPDDFQELSTSFPGRSQMMKGRRASLGSANIQARQEPKDNCTSDDEIPGSTMLSSHQAIKDGAVENAVRPSRATLAPVVLVSSGEHEERSDAGSISIFEIAVGRQEQLAVEFESLRARLRESEAWVFRLAGERQSAERRAEALAVAFAKVSADLEKSQDLVSSLREQVNCTACQMRELGDSFDEQLADHARMFALASRAADEARRDASCAENSLAIVREECAGAMSRLNDQERQIEGLECSIAQREDKLSRLQYSAEAESQENARLRAESARLEEDLALLVAQNEQQSAQVRWLREIFRLFLDTRGRWLAAPFGWTLRRKIKKLAELALFDDKHYSVAHPDVAASEQNCLRHYVAHGLDEDREVRFVIS